MIAFGRLYPVPSLKIEGLPLGVLVASKLAKINCLECVTQLFRRQ